MYRYLIVFTSLFIFMSCSGAPLSSTEQKEKETTPLADTQVTLPRVKNNTCKVTPCDENNQQPDTRARKPSDED